MWGCRLAHLSVKMDSSAKGSGRLVDSALFWPLPEVFQLESTLNERRKGIQKGP